MENMQICQSCAMPLQAESTFGTNQDGSKNNDYCANCFQQGAFTADVTMEQLSDFCVAHAEEWGVPMSKEAYKKYNETVFPTLKRWANPTC